MKKSLIALAVLAASGASFAQSNVTLYGIADIWFGIVDDGTVSETNIGSGGVNSSRWGMKGSEDLGGGLKAIFKLENTFDLSTGAGSTAGAAFDNYAYVGVAGGFGEVKLGLVGTAYDNATGGGNAVFNSALSAEKATWQSNTYTWPGNGIMYTTPEMGGFTAEVSYSLGENKTAAVGAGNVTSFNVQYTGGPIFAALGYASEKATGATAAKKYTQLNGTYNFGMAKLLGAYGQIRQDQVADVSEYQIGVDFPVSAVLTVSANYASSTTDAFGGANEIERSGYGIGLAYTLSKRTFLYGGYRDESREQAGAADVDTSLFAVGIQHRF